MGEKRKKSVNVMRENELLREQLLLANEQIKKAEVVIENFVNVLLTPDHRLLSFVRRLLFMKPEIPAGMLRFVRKKARSSSAGQPK